MIDVNAMSPEEARTVVMTARSVLARETKRAMEAETAARGKKALVSMSELRSRVAQEATSAARAWYDSFQVAGVQARVTGLLNELLHNTVLDAIGIERAFGEWRAKSGSPLHDLVKQGAIDCAKKILAGLDLSLAPATLATYEAVARDAFKREVEDAVPRMAREMAKAAAEEWMKEQAELLKREASAAVAVVNSEEAGS